MPSANLNAKIIINSVSPNDLTNTSWDVSFSLNDLEGNFSGGDVAIDDVIFLDTSTEFPGTITRYKITSVSSQNFTDVSCTVVFDDDNSTKPDLNYVPGLDGIIIRPSQFNYNLIPDTSSQLLPNKFSAFPLNSNWKNVADFLNIVGSYNQNKSIISEIDEKISSLFVDNAICLTQEEYDNLEQYDSRTIYLIVGGANVSPTPTLTSTPTSTPTSTSTPTLTSTSTPTLSSTQTLTPTPTLTSTSTPTLSSTNTSTPTPTPTLSSTQTPTPTPTLTSTSTPTLSSTQTPTPTPTLTSTSTPTLSSTNTSTPTPTPTLSSTNTSTPTPTGAPECDWDHEEIETPTPTPTLTSSTTLTPTLTTTPTLTSTPTPTPTLTSTPTPTPTLTTTFCPVINISSVTAKTPLVGGGEIFQLAMSLNPKCCCKVQYKLDPGGTWTDVNASDIDCGYYYTNLVSSLIDINIIP